MLIKFRTYAHAAEAQLALARLQNEGILAMLRNETIYEILPVQALAIQLWINAEDEDETRRILDSVDSSPKEITEEDFREIDQSQIEYLRKQKCHRQRMPWLWIIIALLILLLLVFGW